MHRYDGLFAKSLHYAPITLALLAALVPKELDATVQIFDETAERIPLDLQVDLIGITCITGTSSRAYRYADYYRKRGVCVVMGGPHPSLCPDEAKEHADAVVIGVGDHSWPQLLRDYQQGTLQAFYHPHDANGTPHNIAGRPLPRWDLLNKKRYISLKTVEAVRGCHLNCSFCAYPKAFGRQVVTRPVEDVIAEIKSLRGKEVIFPDVNLTSDLDYCRELLTAMIPLKKWWFGLTTSDMPLDEDLAELLERSGCIGLLIGFESINSASQIEMHKGINKPSQYKALMDSLHKHGILVMGCFAFGADEDGPDVFERTVRLVDEIQIDLPRYAILTPFPHTDLYEQLASEGRIREDNWAMYDVEHCVFSPHQMTPEQLEAGLSQAWLASYSFKSILRRWRWNRWKLLRLGWLYFFVNFGYRKYAREFQIFGADVMADNADIPE